MPKSRRLPLPIPAPRRSGSKRCDRLSAVLPRSSPGVHERVRSTRHGEVPADLQRMKSVSPHALLPMCVTRIRGSHVRKPCRPRAGRGIAAALKQPDWRVKNHAAWAREVHPQELRRALITARDTEQVMKSGADPDAAFREWVVNVTAKRG